MADIAYLAKLAGIWSSFKDVWGNDHYVSEDTIKHLLKMLGFPADTHDEAEQSASKLKARQESPFPPIRALQAKRQTRISAPGGVEWHLKDEGGKTQQGKILRDAVVLPPLPPGYYDLGIKTTSDEFITFLIVAPDKCWLPDAMQGGKRVWGFSTQLYDIVSEKNCGMGDLGDLTVLAAFAAGQKADIIGMNPLHALFPSHPEFCYPYSPSSRLFLNILYIDVTAIDGFSACENVTKIWQTEEIQEKRKRARESEYVDYTLVSEIKYAILKPLFTYFKTLSRSDAYDLFCEEAGECLHQHAVFDALSDYFYKQKGAFQSWRQWPEVYRNPHSPEVAAFAAGNSDTVDFYKWLQWIADAQLGNAHTAARKHGMEIGLYRDLAVGTEDAGAEMWSNASGFVAHTTIGVPPDEYNPNGQNWGLRAFNPYQLRESRYEPFIRLLRANMRHSRALRIDHAFGLSRLFMVPEGKTAAEGTYIDFPFEEMLAILRLESHRDQCIIIGEDLGTFPPNYENAARDSGLLSYKILFFEREPDGSFKRPDHYAPLSLATLSTHDLPTLAGWLEGEDIKEKENLHIYPSEHVLHQDREARARDRPLLLDALHKITSDESFSAAEKAQLYLAQTPCAIVTIQIEDLLGVVRQNNIPTTTSERPNWRMKLPSGLEKIVSDERLQLLAAHVTTLRKKPLFDYPRATYRLQFHKDFTFYHAAAAVPYLAKLGISHVYASPYLQARPGSKHGYDVTDYNSLNAELGGKEGYEVFCRALRDNGLKQILDFVPNHMGVGGADNAWWLSVLEWGRQSPYSGYFDIIWESRYSKDTPKIIVPFLDDHYGDVLDRGDLKLAFDKKEGSFSVWYFHHRFGICPGDYSVICPSIRPIENYDDGERCKAELSASPQLHDAIALCVNEINNSKEQLHKLLERQHYRLAFWRVASSDINFRRFFDINDLAGLRVEHEGLFKAMHKFVLSLVEQGRISGLRIDHIDGLANPSAYCNALKREAGSSLYLVVEKILASHENLPTSWNIEGTSGYDALNMIGNVFVPTRGAKAFDRIYRRYTGITQSFDDIAYDAKILILGTTLASELQTLTLLLKRIAEHSPYTRDYPFDTLKQALKETIGRFPVYRTYVTPEHVREEDIRIVNQAINKAKKSSRLVDTSVYDFIASVLLLEDIHAGASAITFVGKFQQLTGPVMAKGTEDTAFYRFNRLISLNEVGGMPEHFGLPLKNFHQINKARSEKLPFSMLATATHDTKRGEDMRMRLHVLSERPVLWSKCLRHWSEFNRTCRRMDEGLSIPSPNDEYFIYQTLLGSWPNELMTLPLNAGNLGDYLKRLESYLIKAMRESKVHSTWNNPNTVYEEGVLNFLRQILDSGRINPFLGHFVPVAKCLAALGMLNSLSQTALKLTLPGIPDIYQGTELWDYNLVDPDNRRPVDYTLRDVFLTQDVEPLTKQLLHWQDGKVKQRLIHTLLQHRAAHSDLYSYGDYVPLVAQGEAADHVLAFSRSYKNEKLIVVVPIFVGGTDEPDSALSLDLYKNTNLDIPPGHYKNIFTMQRTMNGKNILEFAREFPVIALITDC